MYKSTILSSSIGILLVIVIILFFNQNFQLELTTSSDVITINLLDAIESGNESKCFQIENEDYIDECLYHFKTCASDICYFNQAQINVDEELCFQIENETLVSACSATLIYSKVFEDSVIQENISICTSLESAEHIKYCQNNYWFAHAVNTGSLSLCENIENEVMRNECYTN